MGKRAAKQKMVAKKRAAKQKRAERTAKRVRTMKRRIAPTPMRMDQRPRARKMKRKGVPRRSPGMKRMKTLTRRKRARINRQHLVQLVHLIITTMPHNFELPILYLSI